MSNILRTVRFATEKHEGQFRAGDKKIPYIYHPLAVAVMVEDAGGSEEVVCAALLHDVIEDCGVKDEEILALYPKNTEFGQRVLSVVKEVTDPPDKIPYTQIKEREIEKMKHEYSREAKLLKIADQTCNMRDLVITPPKWSADQSEEREYIALMYRLVAMGRGTNLPLEQLFHKAYVEACKFYNYRPY